MDDKVLTAEKAREIIESSKGCTPDPQLEWEVAQALGYLQCLEEGPEVRKLVEAAEKISRGDIADPEELETALQPFRAQKEKR